LQTRNDNKKCKSEALKKGWAERKKRGGSKISCNPALPWQDLDKRGNPVISFELDDNQREKILLIIKLDKDCEEKITKKFRSEFIRLYTRYRKAIMRANGESSERVRKFTVREGDKKRIVSAVITCLERKLLPIELFQYWHNRVFNLYDGARMKIPPLSFLTSEYAIITAAEADDNEIERPAEDVIENIFGSDYSQLNKLDPRIRPRLSKSRHGDFGFNDRELLSVQIAARALASGCDVFIDDKIIEAAKYLAKTLYKDLCN